MALCLAWEKLMADPNLKIPANMRDRDDGKMVSSRLRRKVPRKNRCAPKIGSHLLSPEKGKFLFIDPKMTTMI